MCGIGGVWGARALAEPQRLASLFSNSLAHRGPDGVGFLGIEESGRGVLAKEPEQLGAGPLVGLLVHRRLSIIDLATGDQPMALLGERLWIVFNGEIYNYPELRQELITLEGEPFRTASDTEVILRVYRRWGVEGFRRLNGIFALGLFDADRREVVLARDPVGVKPLYWTEGAHGVAFASEIRPLLEAGFVDRSLSPEALAQYVFYRFVPSPHTVWRSVRKIPPGHALRFDGGGRCVAEIDFAAPAPAPVRGVETSSDVLAEQFSSAVRRQMLADVPVGAFLSGGLDSSLVVAALGPQARGLPTFAVGFPDEPGRVSEVEIAARAAETLGTAHESRELALDGYFERLPWAIEQAEEPLAHPGMLLQADLSALARRRVKVVLTGQGADEPLGGYPRHHAARLLPLLAGMLGGAARSPWVARLGSGREVIARIRRVLAAAPGVERAAALFSPLSPEEAGAMVRGCGATNGRAAVLAGIRPWWDRGAGLDDVARTLYVDVRTSLAEDLLLVADKMSMAHSLEARVPYLDLEYLAGLEAVPGHARVRLWGSRKRLQRDLGRRLLPPSLARSLAGSASPLRRKHGFDVPVAEWFRGPLRDRLPALLTGSDSALPCYFDADRIRSCLDAYLRGSGRAYRQVLAFYVLEIWLRANLVGRVSSKAC